MLLSPVNAGSGKRIPTPVLVSPPALLVPNAPALQMAGPAIDCASTITAVIPTIKLLFQQQALHQGHVRVVPILEEGWQTNSLARMFLVKGSRNVLA